MKKMFLFLVFAGIAFTGCKLVDRLTHFDMNYNQTVVIPSSTGINMPYNIMTPDMETNSESSFQVNDTRKDLIEEIRLKSLNLTITSPAGSDFSFLKSINVFISAESLPEIKIACKNNIPSDIGASLTLDTVNVDLKDYIKKDKITLKLNTVTDEILTSDYHVDVNSVFYVDAKILGQ